MDNEKTTLIPNLWKQFKIICLNRIIAPVREDFTPCSAMEGIKGFHPQKITVLAAPYWPYLLIILMTLMILVIGKLFHAIFNLTNIALLHLLPVLFAAVFWGLRPSIFASIFNVLAFDFFFVPPILTFTVADLKYITVFVVFLLVAFITGTLATSLRNQAANARQREKRTAALYELSSKIAAETDLGIVMNTVVRVIADTIEGEVFLLTPEKTEDKLTVRAFTDPSLVGQLTRIELETAKWVYDHGGPAGKGAREHEGASCLYLPIKTEGKKLGVLGLRFHSLERKQLPADQQQLLEAFCNLAAIAVVRLQLAAEAEKTRYLMESEKLRTALFNSISHDLRTPLASITGAVTGLLEGEEVFDTAARQDLLQTIRDGAARLNRLVGNLLDMARIESGMLKLKQEWCDIQDILGVALRQFQEPLSDCQIQVDIPEELPLLKADFSLIEQVFINLLENAAKYAPPKSIVKISIRCRVQEMYVAIADNGPGIPMSDRERIFDKFYRLSETRQVGGTGLGLSICKGIIEAHGGKIWVESQSQERDTPAGGSTFIFTMPLVEQPPDRILPEN